MTAGPDATATTRFAFDARSLDALRTQAKRDPDAALKQAATQFEAVFMRALLKSMREALPGGDPLASEAGRMYTGMHDEQIAQKLAERGLGIADLMVRQLSAGARGAQHAALTPQSAMPRDAATSRLASAASDGASAAAGGATVAQRFIERMAPHARAAALETGVPARFVLGQAALESGWGLREIRSPDGGASFNLFGLKAGRNWNGRVVESPTTEYANGVARRSVERFRAYDSYAEAFADYARLLKGNPRYAVALAGGRDAEAFAAGMQRAGYATDPRYAEKLARVINSASLKGVPA
ncbi:MAG: flagellar assembly peptidoglycan hydrolase FlgJ [Betaproteobacteria bacterium]